jgi:hypothetical protein
MNPFGYKTEVGQERLHTFQLLLQKWKTAAVPFLQNP